MKTKQAPLKARDVMTNEPVCVTRDTSIRALARIFEENEVSGAPVVDQQGKLIGVVSKTDLIRRCSEGTVDVPPAYLYEVLCEQESAEGAMEPIPEQLVCVEDFMTQDAVTVKPSAGLKDVARQMFTNHIHRVVVVDKDNFPIGVITSLDIMGALAR